jgi:hypothetical protein
VRPSFLRRYTHLSLIAAPLMIVVAIFGAPAQATAPPAPPRVPPTIPLRTLSFTPPQAARSAAASAATRLLPADATTPNPTPPTEQPPTRPAGRPLRVGIQAGHWRSEELPDEQAHLRGSSGAFAAGYAEVTVSLDIARRVAALLARDGIVVDVLPATVPPGYAADAFVALHADGAEQTDICGFKLATPWWSSSASHDLLDALTAEYGKATVRPRDVAITANMRGYYAFNYRRYAHAISRTTPAVIIEMGFLTCADDRALLVNQPDTVAIGIANGIVRYLNEHDVHNAAALLPPDFGVQRAAKVADLGVRAEPHDDATPLLSIEADRPVIPFEERDGWYHVIVVGAWDVVGWVRKDEVTVIRGS